MLKYDKFMAVDPEQPSPLVDGENIIWSSKPKKSAYIINQILTMLPIALIWLAFDSFFIAMMFKTGDISEMLFFIIPFFIIHLMPVWIWLGNVLSASKKWSKTHYYVTDKRIIIQNGFIADSYHTIYYKDIQNIYLHIGIIDKLLKVGDIKIQVNSLNKGNHSFLDISNPQDVYLKLQKVILDIQADIEYPNALRPEENPGYNTKYNPKI